MSNELKCLAEVTYRSLDTSWKDIRIDVGWKYWTYQGDHRGYMYGKREHAVSAAMNDGIHESDIIDHDTRLTVREVIKKIQKAENTFLNLDDEWSVGPWEDYFNSMLSSDDVYWPDGRIFVSVVRGSNEGFYLHIMVDRRNNDTNVKTVIMGKTLSEGHVDWQKCWESAMRISWYLTGY